MLTKSVIAEVATKFLRSTSLLRLAATYSSSRMTGPIPSSATFGWCCVASANENGNVVVERVNGYGASTQWLRFAQEKSLDVTTSPDWMEYELSENGSDEDGAYDTYRCDLVLGVADEADRWRIWGQEFHLNRLQESYRSIDPMRSTESTNEQTSDKSKKAMESALEKSKHMVKALLQEAENASVLHSHAASIASWEDVPIQLVRVTVLWSPSTTHDIVVRAHATSSAVPTAVHEQVQPIHVTIAAKQQHNHSVSVDTAMPSRLRDPQHKIASWTRERQKMRPYKPPAVSEVLMVRPTAGDKTEVLEGLSSNVFVVYRDGTLRTAQDGVLYGYARHLVLECAASCGLEVVSKPIVLQDAEEGLWKEAFITSSSRLIYPISKVLLPTEDEEEFSEYWADLVLVEKEILPANEKPKWQQLLDEVLKRGGYPRFC